MAIESRQPPPATSSSSGLGGGGTSIASASFGMFDGNSTATGNPKMMMMMNNNNNTPIPQQHPYGAGTAAAASLPSASLSFTIPSEAQLTLLCLDYLRDLLRTVGPSNLEQSEGLNGDWLCLAVFCLSQSFCDADLKDNHDAWKNSNSNNNHFYSPKQRLPPLEEIKRQILEHPQMNPNKDNNDNDNMDNETADPTLPAGNNNNNKANATPIDWYDCYDDTHISNLHRLFPMNGLASRPLFLGEILALTMGTNPIRSRLSAEEEMIQSPLFEQFLHAVESKGFFKNNHEESDPAKAEQLYHERYNKVVAKFRTKLASKGGGGGGGVNGNGNAVGVGSSSATANGSNSEPGGVGGGLDRAQLLWERHQQRRFYNLEQSRQDEDDDDDDDADDDNEREETKYNEHTQRPQGPPPPKTIVPVSSPSNNNNGSFPLSPRHNPEDLEEAEALKTKGNAAMQRKEYQVAADAYTAALKLSPDGPNSHVYFSNRAAALLSQKEFQKAIADSERALRLKPNYGKAHARLGLAHFLLGDYRLAMEAYTVALKYEPDNKSSRSYLEKAAKRLAVESEKNEANNGAGNNNNPHAHGAASTTGTVNSASTASESHHPQKSNAMSFSVVSEWDKSKKNSNNSSSASKNNNNNAAYSNIDPAELIREAEKHKVRGNQHMANRDYEAALQSYTAALDRTPRGPQSHVYYSNRAAALCYLERYEEAANDSETAIQLQPTYGKAHARLGLSRFFLNDYQGAIDAYTHALQYDPDNAASKSYLAKAKLKLERTKSSLNNNGTSNTSSSNSSSNNNNSSSNRQQQQPTHLQQASSSSSSQQQQQQPDNHPNRHSFYQPSTPVFSTLNSNTNNSSKKSTPQKLPRQRSSSSSSYDQKQQQQYPQSAFFPQEEKRRLMEDPDMQLMAKKALSGGGFGGNGAGGASSLLEDPEMQSMARKAMNDPTMMEAVMAVSSSSSRL